MPRHPVLPLASSPLQKVAEEVLLGRRSFLIFDLFFALLTPTLI
jgi:hypothetical protein